MKLFIVRFSEDDCDVTTLQRGLFSTKELAIDAMINDANVFVDGIDGTEFTLEKQGLEGNTYHIHLKEEASCFQDGWYEIVEVELDPIL